VAAAGRGQSQRHRPGFVLVRGISDIPPTRLRRRREHRRARPLEQTAARQRGCFLATTCWEAGRNGQRGEVRPPRTGSRSWLVGQGRRRPSARSSVVGGDEARGGPDVMVSSAIGADAPARAEPH